MSLLDLFFPPICLHCERLGSWICQRCVGDLLPLTRGQLPSLRTYPGLQTIRSAYAYDGPAESFVKNVKYDFVRAAIATQAQLIDLQLGKQVAHWNLDGLVPIPLHPKRHAWRGFNQSELLCQELGKLWQLPVFPVLERVRWQHTQAGSSRSDRHSLRHHFQLHTTLQPGKRLALVDDVVTTGSTLSACARELEKTAPSWLGALTFAAA